MFILFSLRLPNSLVNVQLFVGKNFFIYFLTIMLNLIFNWEKTLYLPSAPNYFELIFIIRKIVQFFSKNFHKLFIICEKGKQKATVFWPSNFQCGITLTSFSYLQYYLGVFEEILPKKKMFSFY